MHDQHLADAAAALSRAIGNRWGGWYAVELDQDAHGGGLIRVVFDRDHVPALSVGAIYNGYVVRLEPTTPPRR